MTRLTAMLGSLLALACATSKGTGELRDLPVGLAPAGAHLSGCAIEEDGELVRARCDADVVLSMMTRRAGAAEPGYRAEAFALGSVAGARIAWDRVVVPTEGPSGAVERARALAPLAQQPVATLIGTVRDVGGHDVQEVWCSSRDGAGDQRCRALVGAVLGVVPSAAGTSGTEGGAGLRAVARSSGPANVFGRALSLPTSCAATMRPDGGDASCGDGATLSWRKLDSMEEASELLTATLAALGLTEGQPFACTLVGEVGQCEDFGGAVAALAYLDGTAVAATCLGVSAAREHALCRAVLHAR